MEPFAVLKMRRLRPFVFWLAFNCGAAYAQGGDLPELRVLRHLSVGEIRAPQGSVAATHQLRVTLALMNETGWDAAKVLSAARQAAGILAQCAIRISIDLHEFEGPPRYRSVLTPVSRDLAGRLALPRPTVFFVANSRQRPPFDAETVGRGNSRGRPEMADTIWVAAGARDLPLVIAHELVHVLADSGAHSAEAGNLMREETAQGGIQLTPRQCEAMVTIGGANGLLTRLQ